MDLLVIGSLLLFTSLLLHELGMLGASFAKLPTMAVYGGAYNTLLAAFGISLIVMGKSQATFLMVWEPLFEWRVVSHILMLPEVYRDHTSLHRPGILSCWELRFGDSLISGQTAISLRFSCLAALRFGAW